MPNSKFFAAYWRSKCFNYIDAKHNSIECRKTVMDPLSNSNSDEATINNISLDWYVDFVAGRIRGSATLTTKIIKATNKIVSL